MSNSRRWRKLMEWLSHLQDTGNANHLNFEQLQSKIDEIKGGELAKNALEVER